MRTLLLLLTISIVAISQVSAQKLIIGERAPELKVKEWVTPKASDTGKTRLVEFFFSTSQPSVERLAIADQMAKKYSDKLVVIVIAKENKEKILEILAPSSRILCIALDDAGKTFDSYGVQFVPFSVLIDSKGRILWFGNSTSLTDQTIGKYL